MKSMNWISNGWSRPSWRRTSSTFTGSIPAAPPGPATISTARSPGARRRKRNTASVDSRTTPIPAMRRWERNSGSCMRPSEHSAGVPAREWRPPGGVPRRLGLLQPDVVVAGAVVEPIGLPAPDHGLAIEVPAEGAVHQDPAAAGLAQAAQLQLVDQLLALGRVGLLGLLPVEGQQVLLADVARVERTLAGQEGAEDRL